MKNEQDYITEEGKPLANGKITDGWILIASLTLLEQSKMGFSARDLMYEIEMLTEGEVKITEKTAAIHLNNIVTGLRHNPDKKCKVLRKKKIGTNIVKTVYKIIHYKR